MALIHSTFVSRPQLAGGVYNTFWAADGTAFTRFVSTYSIASAPAPASALWPVPASPTDDLSQWIWRANAPATDFSAGVTLQFELVALNIFQGIVPGFGATADAVVYVMADNAFNIELQFQTDLGVTSQIFVLSDSPLPVNTPQQASQPFGWQNTYIYSLNNIFNSADIAGTIVDMDFRGKATNYLAANGPATNTAGIIFRADVHSHTSIG